ncbi:MAG: hypothetical protein P1U63_04475 [Coxiellaceae bacterium]|nr:hypothetical protein [Coxiellaceae bacterium]
MITEQTQAQLRQQRTSHLKKSAAYWALCAVGVIGFCCVAYKAADCLSAETDPQQWHLLNKDNETVTDIYSDRPPHADMLSTFANLLLTQANFTLQAFNQTTPTEAIKYPVGVMPFSECVTAKLTTTATKTSSVYRTIKRAANDTSGIAVGQVQPMQLGLIFAAIAAVAVIITGTQNAMKHREKAIRVGNQSSALALSTFAQIPTAPFVLNPLDEDDTFDTRLTLEETRAAIVKADDDYVRSIQVV